MSEDITKHDGRARRCPMLGHDVPFSYCRAPGSEVPCRRIFDCWWQTFDVEGFIREHYNDEEIQKIASPRKAKLTSLVEMIEKAKKAAKDSPDRRS